jgi:hypothetical protein
MNVDVQSPGFPITDTQSDHARRRLRLLLTRYSDRILRVLVRFGDHNGPRGGLDKFCRIQVTLIDAPAVVVHDSGAEILEVIDRATDRAGRVVVKHLERSRTFTRPGRAGADALSID